MKVAKFQNINTRLDAEVLCDRCGGTCITDRRVFNGVENISVEASSFTAQWGYGSRLDGDKWSAELCQECSVAVYEFIEAGAGNGVDVTTTFGNLTAYGMDGTIKKLERICQEDVGMGAEEFLTYIEKGEVPEDIPAQQLSRAIHLAKFWLEFKEIPEEEWLLQ